MLIMMRWEHVSHEKRMPQLWQIVVAFKRWKNRLCPACDSQYVIEDNVIKHRMEGSITIEGLTTKVSCSSGQSSICRKGSMLMPLPCIMK